MADSLWVVPLQTVDDVGDIVGTLGGIFAGHHDEVLYGVWATKSCAKEEGWDAVLGFLRLEVSRWWGLEGKGRGKDFDGFYLCGGEGVSGWLEVV